MSDYKKQVEEKAQEMINKANVKLPPEDKFYSEKIMEHVEVKTIKTVDGKTMDLPRFTLRAEFGILRLFMKIEKLVDAKKTDSQMETIKKAFEHEEGYQLILDLLCLFIGQSEEFILDNFDIVEVLGTLVPFFIWKMSQITKKMEAKGLA